MLESDILSNECSLDLVARLRGEQTPREALRQQFTSSLFINTHKYRKVSRLLFRVLLGFWAIFFLYYPTKQISITPQPPRSARNFLSKHSSSAPEVAHPVSNTPPPGTATRAKDQYQILNFFEKCYSCYKDRALGTEHFCARYGRYYHVNGLHAKAFKALREVSGRGGVVLAAQTTCLQLRFESIKGVGTGVTLPSNTGPSPPVRTQLFFTLTFFATAPDAIGKYGLGVRIGQRTEYPGGQHHSTPVFW